LRKTWKGQVIRVFTPVQERYLTLRFPLTLYSLPPRILVLACGFFFPPFFRSFFPLSRCSGNSGPPDVSGIELEFFSWQLPPLFRRASRRKAGSTVLPPPGPRAAVVFFFLLPSNWPALRTVQTSFFPRSSAEANNPGHRVCQYF